MTTLYTQKELSPKPVRRWNRHQIDVPVRLISWTDSPLRAKISDARGREMSEGGMAIFAGVELPIGATVNIEFTPAYSGQPLRVSAEVRNRNGYLYGCEFLNETSAEQDQGARLRQLLVTATGCGV